MSFPWRFLDRSAAPAQAAGPRTAAGTEARPPASPVPAVGTDPFSGDEAGGNPDLSVWPPTTTERNLAVLALGCAACADSLRKVTGSTARAAAIIHLLRVERAAADVVAQALGGPR